MKKILSMLLAVMFIFSCLTFTAGAAETENTEIIISGINQTDTKELEPKLLDGWHGTGQMGEYVYRVGMLRSRQYVGETETIRFMPNIDFLDSQMVSYVPSGATVGTNGYKYVAVSYYYTAPEKAAGALTGVYYAIEFSGQLVKSKEPLVANKWSIAVLDLSGCQDATFSRFNVYPFGAAKNRDAVEGTLSKNINKNHAIDVSKMIFCKEDPTGATVTGKEPGRDFYFVSGHQKLSNNGSNEILPGSILTMNNFSNTKTLHLVSNGDTTRSLGIRWYMTYAENIPDDFQLAGDDPVGNWGNGVDIREYDYVSVYYYYTVPEGETPNNADMSIRLMCRQPTYYASGEIKTQKIANEWAVATFDISKLPSNNNIIKPKATELVLNPYGYSSTGTEAPLTHSFDIARVVFHKDTPVVMDSKLSNNSTGLVPAAGTKEVPVCEISQVDLVNPEEANISGLAAEHVTTDGYEYIGLSKSTGEDNSVKYWLSHNNNTKVQHSPLHKKYIKVDYFYYKDGKVEGASSGAYMRLSTLYDDNVQSNPCNSEKEMIYNKWDTAIFDIGANAGASGWRFNKIALYPFENSASVGNTDKVYFASISLHEEEPNGLSSEYVPLRHTSDGDFVPTLDNIEYNSEYFRQSDTTVENAQMTVEPFIVGEAAKITPPMSGAVPKITIDYTDLEYQKVKYRPFIRLEYFMNVSQNDFIKVMKPVILIVTEQHSIGYEMEFSKPLSHGWHAQNLDLSNEAFADENIVSLVFYPYGTDANKYSGYIYEHNKFYLNKIVFSQEEISGELSYPEPEMNEEGEFVPYKYESTDGLPVVYYSNTGVYSGKASGSIDQAHAYGTLAQAVSAVDSLGGGYVILCSDAAIDELSVPVGNLNGEQLPDHKNMVILRGMQKDGEKVSLHVGAGTGSAKASYTHGPLWLQNLTIVSTVSPTLRTEGNTFNYGTQGADENDVTFVNGGSAGTFKIEGASNGGEWDKVELNFYSGTFNSIISLVGGFNGTTVKGGVNVGFHGTDLRNAEINAFGGWDASVGGDFNINITAGKFKKGFINSYLQSAYTGTVAGNMYIKITGGDFSSMSDGTLTSSSPSGGKTKNFTVLGTKTIDIIDYSGDVVALKTKIALDSFTDMIAGIVYVSDAGSDTNYGTISAPFATISKAAQSVGPGGRIIILSDYVVPEEGEIIPAHTGAVTISVIDNKQLHLEGVLTLGGSTTIIDTEIVGCATGGIAAKNNKLVLGNGITTSGEDIDISGHNITVNSGTFGDIVGGVTKENSTYDGNVNITINGGTINGSIIGGSTAESATINGNVNITINGGNINDDIIVGDNKGSSTIKGTASIKITDGTFGSNSKITVGNGTVGDKTSVNYRDYKGPSDMSKIIDLDKFNLVIKPKEPKPVFTKNDVNIVILEIIGDPTKALSRGEGYDESEYVEVDMSAGTIVDKNANQEEILDLNSDTIQLSANKFLKPVGAQSFRASVQEFDGRTVAKIKPLIKNAPVEIDVSVAFGSEGALDITEHKYVEISYYYATNKGSNDFGYEFELLGNRIWSVGNVLNGAIYEGAPLETNKWATLVIELSAVEDAKFTSGFIFRPFGDELSTKFRGDELYIESVTFKKSN